MDVTWKEHHQSTWHKIKVVSAVDFDLVPIVIKTGQMQVLFCMTKCWNEAPQVSNAKNFYKKYDWSFVDPIEPEKFLEIQSEATRFLVQPLSI